MHTYIQKSDSRRMSFAKIPKTFYIILILISFSFSGCSVLNKLLVGKPKKKRMTAEERKKKRLDEKKQKFQAMQDKMLKWLKENQQNPPSSDNDMTKFSRLYNNYQGKCNQPRWMKRYGMSETESQELYARCLKKLDDHSYNIWNKSIQKQIAAGNGLLAHWGARTLLKWQSSTRWKGPRSAPTGFLVKGAKLRDKRAQQDFASRKTYAKRHKAKCITVKGQLKSRSRRQHVRHHFSGNSEVRVRCYLAQPLNNLLRGRSMPKLYGLVYIYKANKMRKYSIPIQLSKYLNKDYFDFDYSLRDWSQGSAVGYVVNKGVISWKGGYVSKYDRFSRSTKTTRTTKYQTFTVTISYSR